MKSIPRMLWKQEGKDECGKGITYRKLGKEDGCLCLKCFCFCVRKTVCNTCFYFGVRKTVLCKKFSPGKASFSCSGKAVVRCNKCFCFCVRKTVCNNCFWFCVRKTVLCEHFSSGKAVLFFLGKAVFRFNNYFCYCASKAVLPCDNFSSGKTVLFRSGNANFILCSDTKSFSFRCFSFSEWSVSFTGVVMTVWVGTVLLVAGSKGTVMIEWFDKSEK